MLTTDKAGEGTFAGGCFWYDKTFETLDGVITVTAGYADGTTENPTYHDYVAGGHIEVVQVPYDPKKVSYRKLLDTFWHQIDPTDAGGQFVDRGHAYISAIFVYNDERRDVWPRPRKVEIGGQRHLQEPCHTHSRCPEVLACGRIPSDHDMKN